MEDINLCNPFAGPRQQHRQLWMADHHPGPEVTGVAGGPPSGGPGATFAPISTRVNPVAIGYASGATVASSVLADQLALRALEAQIASQQVALSALQAQIVANQQNAAVISRRLMMTSRLTSGTQHHQSIPPAPAGHELQRHLNPPTNILANSLLSAPSSGAQPSSSTLSNFMAPSASVQMPLGVAAFDQSQNPTAFGDIQQQVCMNNMCGCECLSVCLF